MKRGLIIFALMFFLFPIISAESCTIVERASCTGGSYPVMGINMTTNAHGELLSEDYYPYVLCCDFGDGMQVDECTGTPPTNKIIGLEKINNSHVEIPSLDEYNFDICYEDLVCTDKIECDLMTEMEVLSLESPSNSHIGEAGFYTTKICCSGMCAVGETYTGGQCVLDQVAYWADSEGTYITQKTVIPDSTTLTLVLVNSDLLNGEEVIFKIKESDTGPDDSVIILPPVQVEGGSATTTWSMTTEDLEKAASDNSILFPMDEQDISELGTFYFGVYYGENLLEESNSLEVTISSVECSYITLCMDYRTSDECNQDMCGASEYSIESKDATVSCGETTTNPGGCDILTTCGCEWRDGICGAKKTENIEPNCDGNNPTVIGSCFYEESTSDDCDDDFLDYSWTGLWEYDELNTGPPYYDPDNKIAQCTSDSQQVPCPAQIKLPFFGIFNLIATIIIISIIYFLLGNKKKTIKFKNSKSML